MSESWQGHGWWEGLGRSGLASIPLPARSHPPATLPQRCPAHALCLSNASPSQKWGGFLTPPACLPWGQGASCMRQPWDQRAVCSWCKKNPHGGTSALIYSCDRLGMVQRAGSGMRLISSCVQRKWMGLLAAPGCSGPPCWCQSHPRCPLAPTTLQMKTVNSASVCCLLCSVTSNKAPRLPASLGRSIGKTDTHTHGHFLFLVWGPEEYTGAEAMSLEPPIVHRASSSSGR